MPGVHAGEDVSSPGSCSRMRREGFSLYFGGLVETCWLDAFVFATGRNRLRRAFAAQPRRRT